ncbi:M81 family metallopeptidase [Pollutimonas sp. H1-120]|uniref:M81 family metallopeptidase n=1 Tax=Pollutimonas sp. H1-120 TaxID=3148824 RepID=UPI003B5269C0
MPHTIVSIQFSHETNTFSSSITDMEAFRRRIFVEGDSVAKRFAGTSTELGAHLVAAEQYGWTLRQPFAAHGTPSGLVSRQMLDHCVQMLTRAAAGADGALLALHGAMVAEGIDDAEGYILQQLRHVLGPDKPIVITLDTHANVTPKMGELINGLFVYRTYPHVDQHALALEAAALLNRMLTTGDRFNVHVFKPPMLDGADHGRTHGRGPMPRLLDKAKAICRQHPGIEAVEVSVGFPWSDIEQAGPAVTVTSLAGRDHAGGVIRPLMEELWKTRAERSIELLDLPTVIQEIQQTPEGNGPIVVADFSDNPGHGAPGDGVALLRALHKAGIRGVAAACICDPEAVQECAAAGVGAELRLTFGARRLPQVYGEPFSGHCRVQRIGDGNLVYEGPMRRGTRLTLGPTATVICGELTVILTTNNIQTQDLSFFRSNGVDPTRANVLVVKSQQHFRAAFEPIARRVLLADSGGFVSPDLSRFTYRKVRRPIWPLDEMPDTLPSFI